MTNFIQKFIFKQKMLWHIPINWRWALTRNMGYKKWRVLIDNLACFLQAEEGYHPQGKTIFAAFKATPFNKVRVVIIGQDPYPCKNCSTGIAFFADGKSTPSLKNIYKVVESNLGGKPTDVCLKRWAEQEGVLLLNRVLTLLNNKKGYNTHNRKVWRDFTKAVVQTLTDSKKPIHFMLWGSKVHDLEDFIESPPHVLYTAPHPKSRGDDLRVFLGCRHFFDVDRKLRGRNEKPIKWLP